MLLLTLDQLLLLHALAVQRYGGAVEVRDIGRLESAIETQSQEVFGAELYPQLEQKATALMRNIVADHPFVDGNKRTGALVALTLLELNGKVFVAQPRELEDFAVTVATDHLDIPTITAWLAEHSIAQ